MPDFPHRLRAQRHRRGTDRPQAPGAPTSDSLGTRTTSIARSIAVRTWFRRLGWFLLLDVLLAVTFAATFTWGFVSSLPSDWRRGMALAPDVAFRLEAPAEPARAPYDLSATSMVAERTGERREVAVAPVLPYLYAVGAVMLTAEVLSLVSGLSEARRIRRRLKPLNDLALAADVIANAPDSAVDLRMEHLEEAIAHTAPDAQSISTGDEDLRSIEVALNALLRRMREAQEQQMRFVSDASHELRTPIAVIDGYVSMLDRWGKSDPQVLDESIAALKSESAHMRELVEQLLFLARGDSGRQAVSPAEFDAAALLEEVSQESALIDSGHVYEVSGEKGVPLVADRGLVKQCLRIIVQNAARYSAEGTRIGLGCAADAGARTVRLWVEDQGIGMAAADAEHAFDRFYRADAARDAASSGSGLGLSVAKWVAEAHGGSIDVLSREGLGTRFTLVLPAGGSAV